MSYGTASRLAALRERIRALEHRYGRVEGSVRLLAVSKTKSAAMVREAFEAGQRDFGENQLQDALGKLDALSDLPLNWHFIGHVQSNKTREIAARFQWAQSVDRARIAERLNDQRPPDLPPLDVCIQVNVSAESSKSGIAPDDVPALARRILDLPMLRLRGLMAIPRPEEGSGGAAPPLPPDARADGRARGGGHRAGYPVHRHERRSRSRSRGGRHHGAHRHRHIRASRSGAVSRFGDRAPGSGPLRRVSARAPAPAFPRSSDAPPPCRCATAPRRSHPEGIERPRAPDTGRALRKTPANCG